jgi:hypothetical protein
MGGGGEFVGCCYKPRSVDLASSEGITGEGNSLRLMLGHRVKYSIYWSYNTPQMVLCVLYLLIRAPALQTSKIYLQDLISQSSLM